MQMTLQTVLLKGGMGSGPVFRSPPSACSLPSVPSEQECRGKACCLYLLLLQADDRTIAATPPLPLESRNFLCFDAQDFLVLLVLQFQFLHVKEQP